MHAQLDNYLAAREIICRFDFIIIRRQVQRDCLIFIVYTMQVIWGGSFQTPTSAKTMTL